jgi:hypothetical protein
MPSPRELREHIRSITSTAKITRAMQMVAASKMRKAQQATLMTRPFARLLYRIQRHATARAGEACGVRQGNSNTNIDPTRSTGCMRWSQRKAPFFDQSSWPGLRQIEYGRPIRKEAETTAVPWDSPSTSGVN